MKREARYVIDELARRELESLGLTLHPTTDVSGLLEGLERLIKHDAHQKNLRTEKLTNRGGDASTSE